MLIGRLQSRKHQLLSSMLSRKAVERVGFGKNIISNNAIIQDNKKHLNLVKCSRERTRGTDFSR